MPAVDVINLLKGNVQPKILISESPVSPNTFEIIECKNIGKPDVLSKILITDCEDTVVFDHDNITGFDCRNFMVGSCFKGIFKTCDAIFIGVIDNEPFILIMDMKSVSLKNNENVKKMVAGDLFLEFLNSFLLKYKDIFSYNEDILSWKRFYAIIHCNLQKRTTGFTPASSDSNNPGYIYLQDQGSIKIRKILGMPII
ncbi:hypothetical protein [uncultured Acinetobacter sp.]|uniref:hypothetical protein n=1 Tax=uncultured Acinetobacter sp. TaxID=165433 RepID=UPI00261B54D4|nr:hypothetical protein [uncultured Acinetobacter sp.]